jgi:hypothetical protein
VNLLIEIDESRFSEIIDKTLAQLFKYNEYSAGEAAKYIEQQTRLQLNEQLKRFDFNPMIRKVADEYLSGIIEDVTLEELRKMVKGVVKRMKDKGELVDRNR